MELVTVRFKRNWDRWKEGEMAEIKPGIADVWRQRGIVERAEEGEVAPIQRTASEPEEHTEPPAVETKRVPGPREKN